jgi:hypothetical protein
MSTEWHKRVDIRRNSCGNGFTVISAQDFYGVSQFHQPATSKMWGIGGIVLDCENRFAGCGHGNIFSLPMRYLNFFQKKSSGAMRKSRITRRKAT